MTSFAAVELFMRASLPGVIRSDESRAVWEAPLDSGRSQAVYVIPFTEGDGDVLRIFSAFAPVGVLSASQLNEVLGNEALGVTVFENYYGFVNFVPMKNLEASSLVWPLARVASSADRVEQYFGLGDAL